MTTLTAAQRRALLANAHAKWIATSKNSSIDAVHNLKRTLTETDFIALTDVIQDVRMDGTTIVVTIDADEFIEAIEIDAYGNVLRGAV